MKGFNERDVRRHYDLLQHRPELGLTQLKAMDGGDLIGIGLFDNEADFVSECRRYNGLGALYVGVNPRTNRLLDDYGGLKNRVRTLFQEVVQEGDVDYVTGVAVADPGRLSSAARRFLGDASILFDREAFFPMDEPIPAPEEAQEGVRRQLAEWFYGSPDPEGVPLMQFVRVMGTAVPGGGWLRGRTKFRKYRPYIMEGIAAAIAGKETGGAT